jgi:hypothetical protein
MPQDPQIGPHSTLGRGRFFPLHDDFRRPPSFAVQARPSAQDGVYVSACGVRIAGSAGRERVGGRSTAHRGVLPTFSAFGHSIARRSLDEVLSS